MINGVNTKLQVAHFKLSYSRAFMLRAYLLQSHEMLFDAHYHGLRALGGIPERGIYDNMKTAVDKVGRGKARQVNKRFQAMVSHYLFEAEFCNPAAGWEKGQVEKGVRDARHRIWHDAPAFTSLDELNHWLEARCKTLWQSLPHPEDKRHTIGELRVEEQATLMPMPVMFDGFVEHSFLNVNHAGIVIGFRILGIQLQCGFEFDERVVPFPLFHPHQTQVVVCDGSFGADSQRDFKVAGRFVELSQLR